MNKKTISEMSYVEFISFIQETNRCPGGKDTIRWILKNSFIDKSSNVLEVGSNTGFSSLEVARTAKCHVKGIDPVAEAVNAAKEELDGDTAEIQELVKFEVGSAYDIPAANNEIDLIIAGGSTSFMNQKDTAIQEMERVLKPWGILSVTNLYYHTSPPQEVIDSVSNVIGVKIASMSAEEWKNTYLAAGDFELYAFEKAELKPRSKKDLDTYVEYFMNKPHIKQLPELERDQVREKWRNILEVFNENHRYLGFIKALMRKRAISEEPELFKLDS